MADVKISDLPAAGAITGAELVPVVQGGVTSKTTASALGGASYLVYRALISQEGTDAPVATVLENTLGGTVNWSRDSDGFYLGTLSGAFSSIKTFITLTNTSPTVFLSVGVSDINSVFISTKGFSGASSDDLLFNSAFEILVYP